MNEMIENPVYFDWPPIVVDDGALYHYTKFESFIEIIRTMTLRSSSLSKMNDLNEASIEFIDKSKDFLFLYKIAKYIKNNCSIICFTKNYTKGDFIELGGNHPAMWAHYAEDSNGVCLVLDEKALMEKNKDLLAHYFHKIGDVTYCHNCSPDDSIVKKNIVVYQISFRKTTRSCFSRSTKIGLMKKRRGC